MFRRILISSVVATSVSLVGCDAISGGETSCSCQAVSGRAENTVKCVADGLAMEQFVCEKTPDGLFCGNIGSETETFSSNKTGCGSGFCISDDGENCSQPCACSD